MWCINALLIGNPDLNFLVCSSLFSVRATFGILLSMNSILDGSIFFKKQNYNIRNKYYHNVSFSYYKRTT